MTNERIEPNRQWLVKLTQGASTMLGLGQTAIAITRVIRKRDLGSLWELDPVAAPPKRVQRHLLGTVEQAVPSTSQDSMRDNERYSILRMQLKFAMRKHEVERVRVISRELKAIEHEHRKERHELGVGDDCFALAKVVEWEWYRARLVNVRSREPNLKIEYLATLNGDASRLALPEPRINFLPLEHVRISEPLACDEPIEPPTATCVTVIGVGE